MLYIFSMDYKASILEFFAKGKRKPTAKTIAVGLPQFKSD
jgi:hypothetical protein